MVTLQKNWKYVEHEEYSKELLDTCGGDRIVAQLLANRGIKTPEEAEEFLHISREQLSSPYEFEDMPKVLDRIRQAVESQEHILIYGDFDADGVTGTSILYKTLKKIGANVSYYIPDRVKESHGLNTTAICKLVSSRKIKLIITTDCGISNYQEISLAKNFAVDTIITDHHELPEVLPPAYAVLNPKLLLPSSKMTDMSGAGMSYKLGCALLEDFQMNDYEEEILYLAAIGTIGDLVPLKKENRVIAALGLQSMNEKLPLALKQMAKVASTTLDGSITAETVSFMIAPRLNAVGRLSDGSISVEFLTTEDPDTCENLAKQMEHLNRKRQEMLDQTFNEACAMIKEADLNENKAIILSSKGWHSGIIGIAASKLVEKFYRPTFLMTLTSENAKGSARGVEGLHLFNVLNRHKDLFVHFGGHEYAAGFNVPLSSLARFKQAISHEVNIDLKGKNLIPSISVEMNISPENITPKLVRTLNRLAPFGQENPAPLFSVSNLDITGFKVMGTNQNHMKLMLKATEGSSVEAIWWQHNTLNFDRSAKVKVAFSPEINTYMGQEKVQLIVKDILPTTAAVERRHNNAVKWVDHRKKADISKVFGSYLKVNDCSVAVFAESDAFIEAVSFKCNIINRHYEDKQFTQLVFHEYPSEERILREVIANTKPHIIHMGPYRLSAPLNERNVIKSVHGMLRYAFKNKDGEANVNLMAAKLGTSNDVITAAIDILITAKIITLTIYKDDIVKFTMDMDKNGDALSKLDFTPISSKLSEVDEFRERLKRMPIEEFSYF